MTLEELQAQRDAIPDDKALPASATQADLVAMQQRRSLLDRRLRQAREAKATLEGLSNGEEEARWLGHLNAWRKTLCDELLSLPRKRDAHMLGLQANLTMSIRAIDFGPAYALKNAIYSLDTLRLGQLMIADGLEIVGADPARNYGGELPWHGAVPEVEHRLEDLERRRQLAQAALDEALLDDEVRSTRDADAKQLRDALNALRTKISAEPPYLRVVDRNNDDIDERTLTPLQRQAVAQAREALLAEQRRRETTMTPP